MTNKLNKQLHETHAKRLCAILNAQSTFAAYLNRPEFNTLLKLELNTLAEIEKKLPEDKFEEKYTSKYLVDQFNTLTKTEFKLGEKFKYDDEDDLIDNVNYLLTYCKNIFKVNIDDIVGGKKVVAENPNINLGPKPSMDDEAGMDAANAFNMGMMGYATNPYENPYLMGKAYAKLNKDIAEGKVYQYKTKPRIIVICKWLLIVLLGLSLLSLLMTTIFCFMAHGLSVHVPSLGEKADTFLNTISKGIFYIILIGFGVYTFYVTIKTMIKRNGVNNENALYQFSWYFYLAFIVLGLLVTLLDLPTTWLYSGTFSITEAAGSSRSIGFSAWGICMVISASLIGACIVPMILGAIFAPKQDKQKIEQLIKQYVDEVTPKGPANGPMTHAEVQKPVDVKPVEEKKDESKDSKTEEYKS